MTTIAANRQMIAADSQVTAGSTRSLVKPSKIERYRSAIFACAGPSADAMRFSRWIHAGSPEEKPEMGDSFVAVLLAPEGLFEFYGDLEPLEIAENVTAIGDGAEIALGAMYAGADPVRAVEIACELNVYTGPPVVSEKL